jgi:hypothetical protein
MSRTATLLLAVLTNPSYRQLVRQGFAWVVGRGWRNRQKVIKVSFDLWR